MARRALILATLLALLTALAPTALAGSPVKPAYVYVGKTRQGIAVRLAAQTGSTRWFRYRATLTCNDGSTFTDDYFSDDVPVKHNRFTVADSSNGGAITTRVTGTLTGTRASGTLRIIERYSEVAVNGVTPLDADGAIVCDSRSIPWSARA
jgi:hypothetical protein